MSHRRDRQGAERSGRVLPTPALADQRRFWSAWNEKHRTRGRDAFMERQLDAAVQVALRLNLRNSAILDIGCGTAWLGHALLPFGSVTGVDLSPETIARGAALHPGVRLVAGNFVSADIGSGYDLAVSADAIAHVPDQAAFVEKVARVLLPGGTFLLMTQNPFVWSRMSSLSPRGEGQIRDWPSLSRIRTLLAARFQIVRLSSLAPGGDRGVFRGLRYLNAVMRRTVGRARWDRVLEQRLLFGRELVVEARR